ncbi:MAG: NAD-dependent epimerase/dehydratase family protein [Pyrinomonadaceae bacterium]|nr:NAD-dependent epimerase/dehydratase family protein [Pyrinomonadaceae bacterium]
MGSHICRELVAQGRTVRVFDKLYTSRELIRDIEHDLEIVEGDISCPSEVLPAIADADILIHLVHTTRPGSSMEDPAFDISSNVVASAKWLMLLPKTKARRILFVSSGGTVYGIPQVMPIDENHPTDPVCSYGISKLAIEKYISMYASMFGVEFCLLRPSNVYGEGQRLNVGQGVIGVMADRALRGEPLEIWGAEDNLRDYLHIDDMVSATMSLVDYSGPRRIFNVSSGEGHSVTEIVAMLTRALGFSPQIVRKPDRGFDVPSNVLDSTRLTEETGWRPIIDITAGIKRTVDWIGSRLANEECKLHK